MIERDKRAVAPALVVLGVLGLCLSGFGALPGTPAWCWLVVLALGVVAHVAVEDRVAKAHVAKRLRDRMQAVEQVMTRDHLKLADELAAERRLTSEFLEKWGHAQQENRDEAIRRLNAAVGPLVEAHNKGKLTGHLQNVIGGKQS